MHRHSHVIALLCLSAPLLMAGCTTTTTTTHLPSGGTVRSSPPPKPKKQPAQQPLTPEQQQAADLATAVQQVTATETAFAQTMADRNFQGFVQFLSPEATFFSGSRIDRGAEAVAAAWQSYFVGGQAPFTWRPDHVEVLPSGKLALSTGPVYENHAVVGRFNSIWRLEAPNTWRIVFDKGEAVCNLLPGTP
jgi:ketosteroid isomerase-like protein